MWSGTELPPAGCWGVLGGTGLMVGKRCQAHVGCATVELRGASHWVFTVPWSTVDASYDTLCLTVLVSLDGVQLRYLEFSSWVIGLLCA